RNQCGRPLQQAFLISSGNLHCNVFWNSNLEMIEYSANSFGHRQRPMLLPPDHIVQFRLSPGGLVNLDGTEAAISGKGICQQLSAALTIEAERVARFREQSVPEVKRNGLYSQ